MALDPLEGFVPTDISSLKEKGAGANRCDSRELLDAFLKSGYECVSKEIEKDELKRTVYNLRHYRLRHIDEYERVGISGRGGKLTLYLVEN